MNYDVLVMLMALPGFLLHWLFFHFYIQRISRGRSVMKEGGGSNSLILTVIFGFFLYFIITLAATGMISGAVKAVGAAQSGAL